VVILDGLPRLNLGSFASCLVRCVVQYDSLSPLPSSTLCVRNLIFMSCVTVVTIPCCYVAKYPCCTPHVVACAPYAK